MNTIISFVGSNYGFGLAVREVRKQRMAGRDMTLDQMRRIYRKAKAQDTRHQYGSPGAA